MHIVSQSFFSADCQHYVAQSTCKYAHDLGLAYSRSIFRSVKHGMSRQHFLWHQFVFLSQTCGCLMCSTRLVELKEEGLRRTSITVTLSPPKVMSRAAEMDPAVSDSPLLVHRTRDSTSLSAIQHTDVCCKGSIWLTVLACCDYHFLARSCCCSC